MRDTESPEEQMIDELNLKNYMVHEVRCKGLDRVMKEALDQLSESDMIYVSFDVDSLDCDLVSRGTGTPVSKGFDPNEVERIINHALKTRKVVCLEVTEVNPLLDDGNTMAETAFKVLDKVTKNIEKYYS